MGEKSLLTIMYKDCEKKSVKDDLLLFGKNVWHTFLKFSALFKLYRHAATNLCCKIISWPCQQKLTENDGKDKRALGQEKVSPLAW